MSDSTPSPTPLAPERTALVPHGNLPPARLSRFEGQRPHRVVGWLARVVLDAVCALPAGARDALARGVGGLAWTLGIRRKVALENLALALPERSESERRAIARAAYINMTRVVLESLPRGERLPEGWHTQPIGGGGWEALRAHVASGQGALIATGHFGGWELAGEMLGRWGVRPLNSLVRPLKGALNTRLVENRLRVGGGLIYPKGALREVIKALRLGESVLMVVDQALPAKSALFVPFFGRLASTMPALAAAARQTGAPVFVMVGIREGGRLRLEVEGPIQAPEGEGREALTEHTARVTAVLEGYIRRYPEQWLWLHRRWKVAPPREGAGAVEEEGEPTGGGRGR